MVSKNQQWALVKVDSDGSGEPTVKVLMVYEGPDAQIIAFKHRSKLMQGDVTQSMTCVKDTVMYIVCPVGELSH